MIANGHVALFEGEKPRVALTAVEYAREARTLLVEENKDYLFQEWERLEAEIDAPLVLTFAYKEISAAPSVNKFYENRIKPELVEFIRKREHPTSVKQLRHITGMGPKAAKAFAAKHPTRPENGEADE